MTYQQQPGPDYDPYDRRPQQQSYEQPYPGGYQPPPGYQQQPPGGRPPRRKHTVRNVALSVIGVCVAIIVIAGLASGGAKPGTASAASGTAPAAAVKTAPKLRYIATFRGSGTSDTARFRTPSTWQARWSYSCKSWDGGTAGNFIVLENNSYTSALQVNELAKHGHGRTWAYHNAGSHYLSVASECSWKVKVYGRR